MIRAIVGTAGHVDHGKTALLKALTGIDCDRLPEEKEREITIDLGFAYLKEGEFQIGFIDVPGHEKFLKNLLAGVSGFQYFLFCIALDEGIKAQTIEHMLILKALGLRDGIIALTKMDLVEEGLIEKRRVEVLNLFEKEGFKDIRIIPVSSIKGKNIGYLKGELFRLIKENPPFVNLNPPIIYPVDRVFILSGAGVITTGTLLRGRIEVGMELFLNPSGKKLKVKEIEVYKEKRGEGIAGERVALRVSGVGKEDLWRGVILSNIILPKTKVLTVKTNLIKDIKESTRVRVAHHTKELYGRYHRVNEDLSQIFMEAPVNALRGDKVILRFFSPSDFIGSGEVVDIYLNKIKKGEKVDIGDSIEEDIEIWVKMGGIEGAEERHLWERSGFIERSYFEEVLRRKGIIEHKGILWHREGYESLRKKVFEEVENFKKKSPYAYGVSLKNLFKFFRRYLDEDILLEISRDFGLEIERGLVILRGREELSEDLIKILEFFKKHNLSPPSLEVLSKDLNFSLDEVKKKVKDLVKRGFLIQISIGYYVEKNVLDEAIERLKNTGWEKFSISDFKGLFGLTRRHAIPLLEYLDSKKITVRAKDYRILRK